VKFTKNENAVNEVINYLQFRDKFSILYPMFSPNQHSWAFQLAVRQIISIFCTPIIGYELVLLLLPFSESIEYVLIQASALVDCCENIAELTTPIGGALVLILHSILAICWRSKEKEQQRVACE